MHSREIKIVKENHSRTMESIFAFAVLRQREFYGDHPDSRFSIPWLSLTPSVSISSSKPVLFSARKPAGGLASAGDTKSHSSEPHA